MLEARELVSRLILEIAVKVQGVEDLLENGEIFVIRMLLILKNFACPIMSSAD